MSDVDRVASTLAGIRERGYRNGATGAECARLSDAAAEDIPRLLKALEAVLELADPEKSTGVPPVRIRKAITAALTGEDGD